MLVRKFICKDGDYGIGWLPNWIKDKAIDPGQGITVSHDILEHMVDNIGGAEGELMALGALLWIRGESGWFYNKPMPLMITISEMLASDFEQILQRIYYKEQTLNCPGRTSQLGDYGHWEDDIDALITRGIEEFFENGFDTELPISEKVIRYRAKGWIRKGFRKALQYYHRRHNLNAEEVAYIFDRITKEVERQKNLFEGDTLTIRIDLKTAEVSSFRAFDY